MPVEKTRRKKAQQHSHIRLDENVVAFVLLSEAEGVSLTGAMIIEHARELVAKPRIPPITMALCSNVESDFLYLGTAVKPR